MDYLSFGTSVYGDHKGEWVNEKKPNNLTMVLTGTTENHKISNENNLQYKF